MFIDGLNTAANTEVSAKLLAAQSDVLIKEGYPLDMAHLFRAWFKWGFWSSVAQVVVLFPVIILLRKSCRKTPANCLSWMLFALNFLSTAAWFGLGIFWRYSKGGRLCSGEFIEPLKKEMHETGY